MSAGELLLEHQLRQAGIEFEKEFAFAQDIGRKWRADFLVWTDFDGHKLNDLLIEIDGGGFVAGRHTRGTGFENDAEKASAAAILGYRVIRCTPRQVEDGRALSWIRQALGLERAA